MIDAWSKIAIRSSLAVIALLLTMPHLKAEAIETFKCSQHISQQSSYYDFRSTRQPQCIRKSTSSLSTLRKMAWNEFLESVHSVTVPDPESCSQRYREEEDELFRLLTQDMDQAVSEEALSSIDLEEFSDDITKMYDDLDDYRAQEAEKKQEYSSSKWGEFLKSSAKKLGEAVFFSGPQGVVGKAASKAILSAVHSGYSGAKSLYRRFFGGKADADPSSSGSGVSYAPSLSSNPGGNPPKGNPSGQAVGGAATHASGTKNSSQVKLKDLIPTNSYKVAYIRAATGAAMVGLGAVCVAMDVLLPGVGALPFTLSSAGLDVVARHIETQMPDDGRRLSKLRATIERHHLGHRKREFHELAHETLAEGIDQGIEISTEKALEHAVEKAIEKGVEKTAEASKEIVLQSGYHAASAGSTLAMEHGLQAVPIIGSVYSMTRGLKKGYQAWKGLESSYQEAKIQEEVYRTIVDAEILKKKNHIVDLMVRSEDFSSLYKDSPYRTWKVIKKNHCMCEALSWLDQVSTEAQGQFNERLSYIDKKIEREKNLSAVGESIQGFFGAGKKKAQEKQLKALEDSLLKSRSELLTDQDELYSSVAQLTPYPDRVIRVFEQDFPKSGFMKSPDPNQNKIQSLHEEVLRIRQKNIFLANFIKRRLSKIAMPKSPGATVVSFSLKPAKLRRFDDGNYALKSFTQEAEAQHEKLKSLHEDEIRQVKNLIDQLSRKKKKYR